jgi:endogenous inhibitor of DNA gyrase (YacG/DUF329 family)
MTVQLGRRGEILGGEWKSKATGRLRVSIHSLAGFTIDSAMPKALFCPTCRNVVLIDNENFPFCSDRCRLLDLGKWASGDYKISSPIQDPDLLEELARSERNKPTDDES